MRSTRLSTRTDRTKVEGGEHASANQSAGEIKLADLIWVNINGGSWWPAQVVDEKTVSRKNKPSKRAAGNVLVRLYGSYKYLYVDPLKCRSDFNIILKQNSGCLGEILRKALDQDVSRLKSGKSKKQGSKQASMKSLEVISRRRRVMQHLGLIAPSESLFLKNGTI